jgi:predicted nucleic acid-binding Zn ribbon protein
MDSVRWCRQCGNPIPADKPPNAVYCSQKCGSLFLSLRNGNRRNDIMTPHTRGAVNELRVTVDLMEQGYVVYQGVSPHSKCDLVAIKAERIVRVEVKSGSFNSRGIPYPGISGEQRAGCDSVAYVMPDNSIIYRPELPVL